MGTGSMNPAEQIALAQAYVALSNAHRVDLILPALADTVTYLSANVGRFEGGDAIGGTQPERPKVLRPPSWQDTRQERRGCMTFV